MSFLLRSSYLQFTVTALFIFSTMYTIVYYINEGDGQTTTINALNDRDDTNPDTSHQSFWDSLLSSITIDTVLDWISMLSPFILIKGLIYAITINTPELYTIINLLLLRPAGWVGFLFTLDWGLNKIRGTSE